MQRRHASIIAAVVAGAALLAGALALAAESVGGQSRASNFMQQAAFGGHGHWGRHGGGGFSRFCSESRIKKLDGGLAFFKSYLDIDEAQDAVWNGFAETVRGGNARFDEACESAKDAETPPEKLAGLEVMMAAGLAALQEVRVAFDLLYAALDDEQKQSIAELVNRGQH